VHRISFVLILTICFSLPGICQTQAAPRQKAANPVASAPSPPVHPRAVATHHSVVIDGERVAYTATAGTLILHNKQDQPTAKMFYIAYTRDDMSNLAARPLTFAYNGGPGAASALVDFGGFGPRKIEWPQPGNHLAVRPPYQMAPNPDTLLKSTDLVFVDAVSTGYSRIIPPKGTAKMFYGVNEDADSFTQFIEQYISKYGRWGSPKFLLGESYGTTRSAVLAYDLVRDGIYLNGVILCSTVLTFPTIAFAPGNDWPFIFYIPSYAAVAWYHHRLHSQPASLPDLVKKAEAFAAGPYATALLQGAALSDAEKQSIAGQLSSLTAIRASTWLKVNLRMSLRVFRRSLLGSEDQATGRYDARYTTSELQPFLRIPGHTNAGATSSAIMGALTASFNDYLERHLNYHSSHDYRQLNFQVNRSWDWKYPPPVGMLWGNGWGGSGFLSVAPALARAMTNDRGLELMVNNGYFDMATPFFATEYTLSHMPLPQSARQRITVDYYHCGHMLYLNPRALAVLGRNMNQFIAQASAQPAGGT
jgi:carboxypeptidase C (cathepsin A)